MARHFYINRGRRNNPPIPTLTQILATGLTHWRDRNESKNGDKLAPNGYLSVLSGDLIHMGSAKFYNIASHEELLKLGKIPTKFEGFSI